MAIIRRFLGADILLYAGGRPNRPYFPERPPWIISGYQQIKEHENQENADAGKQMGNQAHAGGNGGIPAIGVGHDDGIEAQGHGDGAYRAYGRP